ncbi:UNVERIFIED_CONTAM: hypothetical protein FKN15_074669 [Acipenser sinensis]
MTAIDLDTYSLSLLTAKEDIQNTRSSTNCTSGTYEFLELNTSGVLKSRTNKLAKYAIGAIKKKLNDKNPHVALYALEETVLFQEWNVLGIEGGTLDGLYFLKSKRALFTYDGTSNKLKLSDSGAGGAAELAGKLHSSRPLYGFCRVEAPGSGQPRLVMIIWVGEGVEETRRTVCAGHIPAIKNFFKEAHVFINAHSPAEVTVENINNIVSKIAPPADRLRRQDRVADTKETVREEEERKEEERRRVLEERRQWERERVLQERKEAEERERKLSEKESLQEEQSFDTVLMLCMCLCPCAQREEEERKEEERRRVLEERRQWERERELRERKEAEEREHKLSEKESLQEEQRAVFQSSEAADVLNTGLCFTGDCKPSWRQRHGKEKNPSGRLQAKLEAEARKREKSKWEEQQREHEEEMRARFRRSESIEMAAEAAVLVSQRSMNPREFFRQLSSSSRTPTSPGSPHSASPLFRPTSPFRAHPLRHTSSPSPSSPGRANPTFSPIHSSPQALSPPDSQPLTPPNSPSALQTSPHRSEASPSCAPPPTGGVASVPSAAAPVQDSRSRRNGSDITELDTTSKVATDCRGEEEFKIETIYKVEIASKEQAERPAEVYPEARPSPVHTHPVLTTEPDLGVESKLKPGRDAGVENAPSEAAELEPELLTSSETAAGTETCLVLETQREAVPRTENGFKWGCEAPAACEAASIEAETKAGEPFTPAEDVLRSEEKETHPAEQSDQEAVAAGIVGTVPPLQLSSTEEDVLWSEEKETHPAEQSEREAVAAGIVGTVSPLQLSSKEEDVLWSKEKETHPAEQSEQSEREAVAAGIVGTVSPLQLSSTEEDVLWSEEKETHPAEQSEREAVAAGIVGTVSPLQLNKDDVIETEEEEAQKELTSEMSLVEEDDGETEEEEGERESSVEHNGTAELNHQMEEHSPQNAPKQVSVSAHCRAVHAGTEVDHTTKEQEERSERVNGKEHSKEPEREMSVRALYDYQAEDDSELSFEPGDIISAVEMVDQGWWRGCSEDGRQGLFPSSYVETL